MRNSIVIIFFFKQKTAYEMRISDWSSDVCSSDLIEPTADGGLRIGATVRNTDLAADARIRRDYGLLSRALVAGASGQLRNKATTAGNLLQRTRRSEEHTSELQSLMRVSYRVLCLTKKNTD